MGGENPTTILGECPFFRAPCKGDKCQLYVTVTRVVDSPITEPRPMNMGTCTFVAQLQSAIDLVKMLGAAIGGTGRRN